MSNAKLLGLVVLPATLALACGSATAGTATVDFESQPFGTQFGGSPAPLSDSPGDLVFTEDGIGVRVDNFTLGAFVGFNNATIGGFTDSAFPTTPATLNNIRLAFDTSGLGGPVSGAVFDYVDFGGDENLVINGTALELTDFASAPALVAGVNVMVTSAPMAGGVEGQVSLSGPLTSLAIGGQELGIDDVRFRFVPEPSTVSLSLLAMLVGIAPANRRRR